MDTINSQDRQTRVNYQLGAQQMLKALCEAQGRTWYGGHIAKPEPQRWIPASMLDPNGKQAREVAAAAERAAAERARLDSLRNPRTSCTYCGVRSDVGCRHNPKF